MKIWKTKLLSILTAMVLFSGVIPAHAESTTIRFEGETGYRQSGGGVEIIENGTLVRSMTKSPTELAAGNIYLEYDIYVEEAGQYTVNWKSSVMAGNNSVSKTTMSVNGNDVAGTKLDGPSGTWNLGNHTANTYFEAGINTVRFTVNETQRSDGLAIFCLDYFEITPKTTVKYEAETYMENQGSGWVAQSTFKYNVASDKTELTAGNVYCEQTVNITKPGVYKMTWRSTKNAGTQYVSPATLSVNALAVEPATAVLDTDPYYIQTANVVLTAGDNKIRFTVNNTKNNGNGAAAVFLLDYIELKYADSAIHYDALKYEGEDPSGSGDANINGESYTNFSGGAIRRIWQNSTTTTTISVPKGGEFDMYLSLGADVNATKCAGGAYLGKCSISINGGEFVELSANNCEYVSGFAGSGFYTNSAIWKYTPGVEFDAGTRTIAVKCTGLGSNGNSNGNFILYDCVELVPKDTAIGDAVIKVPSNKVAADGTLQADSALYYANGYKCSESDITGVSYASSNECVATVDENGLITGINPGIAEISVTYNDTYTARVHITVYDESGIIPISSTYNGTNAILKFTRIANGTGTADVIIGAYSQVDGVDTSLTGVEPIIEIDPDYGKVVTVNKEIAGDKIVAFVWDSVSGMKPITDVIILK